jgi:hypothetical protein
MHFGFTGLIVDAHVYFPCVQIDASIIFVSPFVKTQRLAPLDEGLSGMW